MTHDPLEMLTTKQLAKLLALRPNTIDVWRRSHAGPRFIRIGDGPRPKIRYRRIDVERWLNSHGTGNGSPQPVVALSATTQQRVGTDSDGAVPSPTLYRSQEDVA